MTIQNITAQLPFVDISRFHGPADERKAFIEELTKRSSTTTASSI